MNLPGAARGLVLLAHGARDATWSAPFESLATRLRALEPDWTVRLAFLEFMTPDLGTAAAELVLGGCTHIDVMPMFLGTGGHVRRDLPRLLQAAQASHPQVRLRMHASIGELPAVNAAMAGAIAALLAGRPDASP